VQIENGRNDETIETSRTSHLESGCFDPHLVAAVSSRFVAYKNFVKRFISDGWDGGVI